MFSTFCKSYKSGIWLPGRNCVMGSNLMWSLDETLASVLDVVLPVDNNDLALQGWPTIGADGDLWLCDEPSGNLVGKVNAIQLAAAGAASPLQNRTFTGLMYQGSFCNKKCVESTTEKQRWAATDTSKCNVGTSDWMASWLVKTPAAFIDPGAGNVMLGQKENYGGSATRRGWAFQCPSTGVLSLYWISSGGVYQHLAPANSLVFDNGIHLVTISVDRDGYSKIWVDALTESSQTAAKPESLSQTEDPYCMGSLVRSSQAFTGQIAWHYLQIGTAGDRTGHNTLWNQLKRWNSQYSTSTRAGPLTCFVEEGVTATFGSGMPAYACSGGEHGLVSVASTRQCGPARTQNLLSTAWHDTNVTSSTVDSSNAMRRAVRVVTSSGQSWPTAYRYCDTCTVTGATNVPFIVWAVVRGYGSGTSFRLRTHFAGSAGGTEDLDPISTDALTTTYTLYYGTVTPTNADQTTIEARFGANAAAEGVEVACWGWIQNCDKMPPAWVSTNTSAGTIANQETHVTSTNSNRYATSSFHAIWTVVGHGSGTLPAVDETIFKGCPPSGNHGGETYVRIDAATNTLKAAIYGSDGVLIVDLDSALNLDSGQHVIQLAFNASGTIKDGHYAMLVVDDVLTASYDGGTWTPMSSFDARLECTAGYGVGPREFNGIIQTAKYYRRPHTEWLP